jgi:hypothetical protein
LPKPEFEAERKVIKLVNSVKKQLKKIEAELDEIKTDAKFIRDDSGTGLKGQPGEPRRLLGGPLASQTQSAWGEGLGEPPPLHPRLRTVRVGEIWFRWHRGGAAASGAVSGGAGTR